MGYWRWTNTGVLDGWADRKSVRECDVLYDAMWGAQTNAEDDVPGEPVSLGWPGNHRVISTPVADVYFTIIEGEETPGRGFLFLVAIEDLD